MLLWHLSLVQMILLENNLEDIQAAADDVLSYLEKNYL